MTPRTTGPALRLESLEARDVPAAAVQDVPTLPAWDPVLIDHLRQIADLGRSLGRNPNAFMKVGDSNTARPNFLAPLGSPDYNPLASGLATDHPDLMDTWAKYRAPLPIGGNSYTRQTAAAGSGWTAEVAAGFAPLELWATDASVALVTVGSNDAVLARDPAAYRMQLARLLDFLTGSGVVPILTTIPAMLPVYGHNGSVAALNTVVEDLAAEKQVPLVNLYEAEQPLPFTGVDLGGIHFTTSPAGGGSFHPLDLLFGQNTRNLLTLEALDWVQRNVFAAARPTPPPLPTGAGWVPLTPGHVLAVGSDRGGAPAVRVFDPQSGQLLSWFDAYDPSVTGGVRVAVGDVTGDGVPDLVTVPASSAPAHVRVFSGADGSEVASFFAFEPSFTGGASVAVGDLDGDGRAEIVVGAGAGGAPRVRVFEAGSPDPVRDFFAYEPEARGGVSVAVGDFAGAGPAIATGAGEGGGPLVKLFRLDSDAAARAYFAGDPTVPSGVSVAAGDLDGDGHAELVAAPGGTDVKVLDPDTGSPQAIIRVTDSANPRGPHVAVVPRSGDAGGFVAVGSAPADAPSVKMFTPAGDAAGSFDPAGDSLLRYGVFVGG